MGQNQVVISDVFLSIDFRENWSLPFTSSRGFPHFLAHGLIPPSSKYTMGSGDLTFHLSALSFIIAALCKQIVFKGSERFFVLMT